ncbi:cold-shock protein [Stenotrophomonas sp. YAU14A_MKIMI4_1]|uniref:cold-shock protein n=1 Tax=Stenotrophomonas sp. YAU14A_MKIMI4_1 TaxID=2072408 RepID=UPI000D54012F|nr:cold-shock protein [Stenotrophomonas sp. YAU14A_MKIMI4_1]AWH30828.1 cold-shock protein [Stenotrophomonas sp. YAU14A_MKIMI4_1]
MKRNVFTAVAACIALFGTVWAAWPAPASEQVWSYQKLQPVDYRQLHSNALAFVTVKRRQGFELRARDDRAGPVSFEILCRGVQVLDVESTASHVVIRMPGDAQMRAPDIENLRASFVRWMTIYQNDSWLLTERAGPSWIEKRMEPGGSVAENERCLVGRHLEAG